MTQTENYHCYDIALRLTLIQLCPKLTKSCEFVGSTGTSLTHESKCTLTLEKFKIIQASPCTSGLDPAWKKLFYKSKLIVVKITFHGKSIIITMCPTCSFSSWTMHEKSKVAHNKLSKNPPKHTFLQGTH